MKYRDRAQIAADILRVAMNGSKKTKIMFEAYLSYNQLKSSLSSLVESGHLDHDHATNSYKTTTKGKIFVESYDQMNLLTTAEKNLAVLMKLSSTEAHT